MRMLKIFLIVTAFAGSTCTAQDDLFIFGFFQSYYSAQVIDQTISAEIPGVGPLNIETNEASNSANIQQMNLFFQKDLGDNFTGWVNFELTNSFNFSNNWGDIKIEEAWIRYKYNQKLQVKIGRLIPRFNGLNEVKNRMPYLPYIFRPLIYESAVKGIIPPEDYLPLSAFLQIYGELLVTNALSLNYAVFFGNPEESFIATDDEGTNIRGTDTSTHNQGGGRVGIKLGNLELGTSMSLDNDNLADGREPKRTRLGVDLSYILQNLTVKGEYMTITNDAEVPADSAFSSYDKTFYYGTLLYDVTEKIFGYGMYSAVQDKQNLVLAGNGLQTISIGCGYRFNMAVQAKVQWAKYFLNDGEVTVPIPGPAGTLLLPGEFEIDVQAIYAGVSVFF